MLDLHTLGLAFLEGVGLVLSPCILPILPIILAAGAEGGRKRPLGIIIGFILTFSLFSLLSRQLILLLGIDADILRQVSYGLLILFGVILLSTRLSEEFGEITQRVTTAGEFISLKKGAGLLSGILVGATIGFIWVPCAGPILAVVIVQTITQAATFQSFLILLAFSLGAGIPMLILTLGGRHILTHLSFMKFHAAKIRKLLGLVIIGTVLATSGWFYSPNALLSLPTVTAEKKSIGVDGNKNETKLIHGVTPYPAPEIMDADAWINSSVVNVKDLRHKVILVDFWTYSCVNCVRTIPYLNKWYDQYHDQGLEIIGVHTPEFAFEQKLMNVMHAVEVNNIKYPVALDNQFITWKNYHNQYWPAHYLIDKSGNVVYVHFGEGEYDVMEKNIRYLLGLDEKQNIALPEKPKASHSSSNLTPETYLGSGRMIHFDSRESIVEGHEKSYSYPHHLKVNHWALKGKWLFNAEETTAKSAGASLKLHFHAQKVFLVMGTESGAPIKVSLKLNGHSMLKNGGPGVKDGTLLVEQHTLYEIVSLPKTETREVEIIAQDPGLQIYAFTFG